MEILNEPISIEDMGRYIKEIFHGKTPGLQIFIEEFY